jgi:anthranilate/para-aminobenzoate synthase component I
MIQSFEYNKTPWELFLKIRNSYPSAIFIDNWQECGTLIGVVAEETTRGAWSMGMPEAFSMRNPVKASHPGHKTGWFGVVGYPVARCFEDLGPDKHKSPLPDFELSYFRTVLCMQVLKGKSRWELHTQNQQDVPALISIINDVEGSDLLEESAQAFHTGKLQYNIQATEYERWVEATREYIVAGDIFQANLAHALEVPYEGDPAILYQKIRQTNPSPYGCYYKGLDFEVISNSPELLFSVQANGLIQTKPIAGTHPRGADLQADNQLRAQLLSSEKEQAEHLMLVDLERNDLGRICKLGSVQVEKFMDCEAYSHVFHIVSTVSGILREDINTRDVFRAVFPGGTITGAPKVRAMQIIEELEESSRGFYTGSMGCVLDNGTGVWNILIRSLTCYNQIARLQVGAGIVADSIAASEYQETMHKAAAWLKHL